MAPTPAGSQSGRGFCKDGIEKSVGSLAGYHIKAGDRTMGECGGEVHTHDDVMLNGIRKGFLPRKQVVSIRAASDASSIEEFLFGGRSSDVDATWMRPQKNQEWRWCEHQWSGDRLGVGLAP